MVSSRESNERHAIDYRKSEGDNMNQITTTKKPSYLYATLWFIILLVLDQLTKWLAVINLKDQDPFVIIPGVFEFHYLENRGAAFGIFQGKQVVFLVGALLITAVIVFLYRKIPATPRYFPMRLCAVLLSAGAIGNMIDRIRLNYVIDFLYFSLIDFPIFNVADCYVVVACILFAILILFVYKDEDLNFLSFKHKG